MDNVRTKKEILLGQKEDMIMQAISELPEKDTTDIHFIGALKRLADKKRKYLWMKNYYIDNSVMSIVK